MQNVWYNEEVFFWTQCNTMFFTTIYLACSAAMSWNCCWNCSLLLATAAVSRGRPACGTAGASLFLRAMDSNSCWCCSLAWDTAAVSCREILNLSYISSVVLLTWGWDTGLATGRTEGSTWKPSLSATYWTWRHS